MTASSSRTMAGSSTNIESGRVGLGGERVDVNAEFREEMFVRGVLGLGFGEVDGLAINEGEFAAGEGGAYGAGDGGEHARSLARSDRVDSRALKAAAVARYDSRAAFLARAMDDCWAELAEDVAAGALLARVGATANIVCGSANSGGDAGQNAAAKSNGNEQKLEAAVDEVFQDLTAAGSPGCALGVYRGGQIIYEKGYGLANIEENVPISPKSVFDIGSTSKQFTATSILLLEKAGKLSVDDDVHKYIPGVAGLWEENHDSEFAESHERAARLSDAFRYRGRERRQRDDR